MFLHYVLVLKKKFDPLVCVEGSSVVQLLKNPDTVEESCFSQFSRPDAGLNSIPGKPAVDKANHGEDVMGYSMRVDQHHFVEWYKFKFSQIWGDKTL